jgi:hypothetical protein
MGTALQLAVVLDGGSNVMEQRIAAAIGPSGGASFPAYSMATVPHDGTTDATAAFTALLATIPDVGPGFQFLYLKTGETVYFASNFTIPKKVRVLYLGGQFKVANGATLTLNSEPGDVDYQIFDESLGGHVVCGRAMTVQPLWWGGTRDGLSDCSAARDAAHYALAAAAQGGEVFWKAGTWRLDNPMELVGQHFGAQFGTITIRGVGAASILKSGTLYLNAGGLWMGLYTFYGPASPESAFIQKIEFKDIAFEGFDTVTGQDCTTPVIIDQANDMVFTNVWFRWFGIECVRSLSGTAVKHFTGTNCHAYKCGMVRGAGVFNVGAQSTTLANNNFQYVSATIETTNTSTIYTGNRVEDSVWAWMIGSTWAGWIDTLNGNVQYNGRGATIAHNHFLRISDRVGLIPDVRGHANPNYPALQPAHLDGYLGGVTVQGNYYENCAIVQWGGADLTGEIDFLDNDIRGAMGSIPAQTNCIAPTGGIWNVKRNKFRVGNGLTWNALVGTQYVGWAPLPGDSFTFEDNDIIDKCWGPSGMVVNSLYTHTYARNRFRNVDGLLTGATVIYRHSDAAGNVIQQLTANDFAYDDPDHKFSILEAQHIPLRGTTLPPIMNWKVGDRLKQMGTASWNGQRVTVPGTTGHAALTATGSASSGSPIMTMTSTTGLSAYDFVSVPTGGVAAKQIKSVDSSTQVTMTTNFEATVSGGTAVSFATPTLVSW